MNQNIPDFRHFAQANMNVNPFNNMNFNKCMYTPQANPSQLYQAYDGFIRGNMFPDLYNQYKISKPYDIEPMNEQAQLLTYVDALCFARHDIQLYLDNFPNDKAMIQLYNQYREEANRATKQYEEKYGPLWVTSDATNAYPWAWNQLPWPWENK